MKKAILLLLALACVTVFAQPQLSTEVFTPLESQGSFPADLRRAANTPKSDKAYNPFLVAMLTQGRVVYGTEMNQYLDRIVEQLLTNHPQLQQEVHVYILQTPVVNAYSMQNGVILVTTGMMAQVTNEAELAFVLAHEIAHYSEKHGMENDKSQKRDRDVVSGYLRRHSHSRDQEFEADRVGLTTFFKDSPYSYDVLDGIFDVLLYSDLPFDEIPFQRTAVEESFYHFPDNYFLKTVANIADRSNMIDTFLTHPNIERRRTVAKGLVRNLSNDGRKTFVQPEEQFTRLRNVARFACIDQMLVSHQYDKAIYNIYVLQQSFPDNPFLERSLATAWYGAAKHKNYGQTSTMVEPYREVEGERQQVNYLMSKMNRQEYSVFALRKAWAAMRQQPENEYLQSVVKDLMTDIFIKQKMRYVDFCDYPQGTSLEEIAQTGEDTTRYSNKYDRIKQQNMSVKVLPEAKFKAVNYMLVDIHSDSLFRAMVNDVVVNAEMLAVLEEVGDKHIGNEKSLLIMTPTYHTYDNGGNIKSASKDRRDAERLQEIMCRAVKRSGITPVTFNMDFSDPETGKYNDYVKMCRWSRDFSRAGALNMRYHTSEYLDDIAASFGTRKLCYVNVSDSPGRGYFPAKFYLPWIVPVFPYTLPVVTAVLSLRPHEVDVNCLIIDIVDGQIESNSRYSQYEVMRKAYVHGFVYQELERYLRR